MLLLLLHETNMFNFWWACLKQNHAPCSQSPHSLSLDDCACRPTSPCDFRCNRMTLLCMGIVIICRLVLEMKFLRIYFVADFATLVALIHLLDGLDEK
jgi:hypothetical protein